MTQRSQTALLSAGRLLGAIQLAAGLLLSVFPEHVAAAAAGQRSQRAPRQLVRILGLRSLLQGTITTATPTATVLSVGALVDAAHAASMAPLAAFSPRYRRTATLSAGLAALSMVGGALASTLLWRLQRTAAPA